MNQLELEANTCRRRQARENDRVRCENGARLFSQPQSLALQNQCNRELTFDA